MFFLLIDFLEPAKKTSKKRKGKQKPPSSSAKTQINKDPIRNRERNEIIENKPIPEEPKPSTSRRYPKREGARKCYKEQQVPDEDHFLCMYMYLPYIPYIYLHFCSYPSLFDVF